MADPRSALSIAVRAQEGRSTDSCFRQELFSREETDDGMLCQSSLWFFFTYMTFVGCLWFCFDKVEHFNWTALSEQRNRPGYDFNCHRQTKLLWHVLEPPLPVEISRLVALNCVMSFWLWGEEKRGHHPRSSCRSGACTSVAQRWKISPTHLLSAMLVRRQRQKLVPPPTTPQQDMKRLKSKSWKRKESFALIWLHRQQIDLLVWLRRHFLVRLHSRAACRHAQCDFAIW